MRLTMSKLEQTMRFLEQTMRDLEQTMSKLENNYERFGKFSVDSCLTMSKLENVPYFL